MLSILPNIKKPKTKQKFSNPLSGITYDNHSFLQNCNYELPLPPSHQPVRRKAKSVFVKEKKSKSKEKNITRYCYTTQFLNKKKENEEQKKKRQKSGKKLLGETNSFEKIKSPYNDIEIRIIDIIESFQDFKEKRLKANFGIYFNMFFKQTLLGATTPQFLQITEKYLKRIINKNQLQNPLDIKDYPSECFNLKSKYTFVNKVKEYEERGSFNVAEAMVKYYCIPTQQFRESCLGDILHMLGRQLYEKFNVSEDKQYVLLDAEGNLITDVCQIYFSTSLLFISERYNYRSKFANYLYILDSSNTTFKKLSFEEGLKKTFRNRVVNGKFQDYEERNNTSGTQINFRKRDTFMITRKTTNSLKLFQGGNTVNTKFSATARRSTSKVKEVKEKNEPPSFRLQNQYKNEFQSLRNKNSYYDITFNHAHENQILFEVLCKDFSLFSNKSPQQISRILDAAYITLTQVSLDKIKDNSITFEDFMKIRRIADCQGERDDIVRFIRRYMPFNQFGEMNRASLSQILAFILSNNKTSRDIVEEVIWSWLQKNKLIENGVLFKGMLESWFEKNKLVYVMLISLVFGTNEISTLDLAYEVII